MIKPSDIDNIIFEKHSHYFREKESLYDTLSKYKDDEDIYCSFTRTFRLGISPQSSYKDFAPVLGIWCYPLKYILSQIIDIKNMSSEDKLHLDPHLFGSNRKYLFIIKDKHLGRHIHEDIYTDKELEYDIDKIRDYFENEDNPSEWNKNLKGIEKEIKYEYRYRRNNIDGLTNVMMLFCNTSASVSKKLADILNIHAISWTNNQLHDDIKEETVFLNRRSFEIIDVIEDCNKKLFDKSFLQEFDEPSTRSSMWYKFIDSVNKHPEDFELDEINDKNKLVDKFRDWLYNDTNKYDMKDNDEDDDDYQEPFDDEFTQMLMKEFSKNDNGDLGNSKYFRRNN